MDKCCPRKAIVDALDLYIIHHPQDVFTLVSQNKLVQT